jgi:hypothetical protein
MSNDTTDYGEIIIDGYHIPLAEGAKMQPSAVDRFPGKVTVGTDYTKDSNDLLSTWIISDLTGGHGVTELKEGTDDNRYRWATLYTRYPGQITIPFLINYTSLGTGASATVIPLGDMYYNGAYEFYAVGGNSGTTLFRDNVTTTLTSAGLVAAANPGVAFTGTAGTTLFYIPCGASGYITYNRGANTLQANATPLMQSFALWDDKLIGLDTAGQLYYATAAAATTTFTSYGVGGKLDPAHRPKRLEVYYNRAGEPTIHIISDSGVWIFDAATPRLYRIPELAGVHRRFGDASAVWRGNLYVAAGMDLLEWNGSVARNIGLSRDDGLPFVWQGYISSLAPGLNSLYAQVVGQTTGSFQYNSSHEWSGFGWYSVWNSPGTVNILPTQLIVSRSNSQYRLYWGDTKQGTLYFQELPVSFTNPREAIAAGSFTFGRAFSSAESWTLETGRFDAAMTGYQKVANAVEVDVRAIATGQTINVYYRTDFTTSYTLLGNITQTGHRVLSFGTADSDGIYPGIPFEVIELKLEYLDAGAPSGQTSVVDNMVLSFLKVMNPSWSWTVPIDLTSSHSGRSPEQMFDKLVTLKNSGVFYSMKHRDDIYRIRIAGMGGADEAGKDKRGLYTLSVLEIPTKLGAPI